MSHCHFGLFLSSSVVISFRQIMQCSGASFSAFLSSTNSLVLSIWQSAHNNPDMFHSFAGRYRCLPSSLLQTVQNAASLFPNMFRKGNWYFAKTDKKTYFWLLRWGVLWDCKRKTKPYSSVIFSRIFGLIPKICILCCTQNILIKAIPS